MSKRACFHLVTSHFVTWTTTVIYEKTENYDHGHTLIPQDTVKAVLTVVAGVPSGDK